MNEKPTGEGEPRRDRGILASLADPGQGLDAAVAPVAADVLDVAAAPLITSPGQRPLLDLYPVFFPGEPDHAAAQAPSQHTTPTDAEALTYEPLFGLVEAPFRMVPAQKFLFRSKTYSRAERQVLGSLAHHDRLVVAIGEPGTGKTMLCQSIVAQLDRPCVTSVVADAAVSREKLFETLLTGFGVMSGNRPHLPDNDPPAGLADALSAFLVSLARLKTVAVIVVDDAQNLSVDALRGLRALVDTTVSDPARGRSPLVQLMLAGELQLLAKLQRSEFESDIVKRVFLGPLEDDEVLPYIRHRLAVAGNEQVEFDPAAVRRVAQRSFGVPRLVNQLCEGAMMATYRRSVRSVGLSSVAAAARELDLEPPAPRIWRRVLIGVTCAVLLGVVLAAALYRDQIAALIQ